MNVWALSVFLTACVVISVIIAVRKERSRPIRPDLGDTIPERSVKTPIEDS